MGIATFGAGQPVNLTAPNRTISLVNNPLPNRICDGRSSEISGNLRSNGFLWFDTDCFPVPAVGYFGNSGRTVINGPGLNNWDLGVEKSFGVARENRTGCCCGPRCSTPGTTRNSCSLTRTRKPALILAESRQRGHPA
jgi:hypothetical protein